MSPETNGARLGLADVVRLLREDIGNAKRETAEDVKSSEERVTKQIEAAGHAFLAYQSDHLSVHARRSEDTERFHRDLDKKLDDMTVVEARRAGALAVVLLVIRTIGTHWQAVAALVALVGLLLGRVDISLSGPVP